MSLDGAANDGRPGERDNVLSVEVIETTRVATLVAGADPVEFSATNTPAGGSTLIGSPGPDRLRSGAYDDRIDGGAGADAIAAGAGDDTITGGPGPDTILADGGVICDFVACSSSGQGNDTIHARDGERDSIDCGPGTDVAYVDPVDVTSGCETVVTGAQAPGAGGGAATQRGGSGTTPKGGARRCVVPKVGRGATLKSARRALTKAGCKVKVRRVRSKAVRKGRVIGLTRRTGRRHRPVAAGRRLARGATIYVTVSRGRR